VTPNDCRRQLLAFKQVKMFLAPLNLTAPPNAWSGSATEPGDLASPKSGPGHASFGEVKVLYYSSHFNSDTRSWSSSTRYVWKEVVRTWHKKVSILALAIMKNKQQKSTFHDFLSSVTGTSL